MSSSPLKRICYQCGHHTDEHFSTGSLTFDYSCIIKGCSCRISRLNIDLAGIEEEEEGWKQTGGLSKQE